MHTSSDTNDGFYNNYIISRGLWLTDSVNQQDFTIEDAINISQLLNLRDTVGFVLCAAYIICTFQPSLKEAYPQYTIDICQQRKSSHLCQAALFELAPHKIHAIKSINSPVNLPGHIIHIQYS